MLTAAIFRAVSNIAKHKKAQRKLNRGTLAPNRSGVARFLADFYVGFWAEIIQNVGWIYTIQEGKETHSQWFFTYTACERAVKRDVKRGVIEPQVLMWMQDKATGNKASMWTIIKP